VTSRPRVLVTRPAEQAAVLVRALAAAGFEPVAVPLIEVRPLALAPADRQALDPARRYDTLILTSVNAVRFGQLAAEQAGSSLARLVAGGRVVPVGPQTAAAAARLGLAVEAVPERHDGTGVLQHLAGTVVRRALLPRALETADIVGPGLRAVGATVVEVAVYETVARPEAGAALAAAIVGGLDAVTLMSPSAVRALAEALAHGSETLEVVPPGAAYPADDPEPLRLPGCVFLCVGETTAAEARRRLPGPVLLADRQSVAGLVEALSDNFGMSARA
jgi:uroporphyrinogen-III synthase